MDQIVQLDHYMKSAKWNFSVEILCCQRGCFLFFCGFEDVCVYIRLSTTNVGRGRICDVLVNSVLSYQTMAVGIPSVDFTRRTMKHCERGAYVPNQKSIEHKRLGIYYNFAHGCLWAIEWIGNRRPDCVATTCEEHARHRIRNHYHETRRRDVPTD